MNIKKILELSKEEFDLLMNAGKLIASINTAKLEQTIDEFSPEVVNLIVALRDALNRDGIISGIEAKDENN